MLFSAAVANASLVAGSLTDGIPSLVYNSDDGSLFIETGVAYGGPSALYNVTVSSYEGIFYSSRASDVIWYATDYSIVTQTDMALSDGTVLGDPGFIRNEAEWFLQDDLSFSFQIDPYGSYWTSDLVYYTPPADIPGDQNGDGFVGISDLNIILSSWNQSVPGNSQADPSDDGFVGIEDLNIVLSNWNAGTPPAAAAVPEPGTAVLLAAAIGAGMIRRRKS